jgi:hypothetical protein
MARRKMGLVSTQKLIVFHKRNSREFTYENKSHIRKNWTIQWRVDTADSGICSIFRVTDTEGTADDGALRCREKSKKKTFVFVRHFVEILL